MSCVVLVDKALSGSLINLLDSLFYKSLGLRCVSGGSNVSLLYSGFESRISGLVSGCSGLIDENSLRSCFDIGH